MSTQKNTSQAAMAGTPRRSLYLFIAAAVLALVGLTDAIYLTVKHFAGGAVCNEGGCNEVLGSSYAKIAGVPLAGIGALAYFTVFSLAILAAFGNRTARTLLFYLVAFMFAFSIWLFSLQAFVIHHFCPFCLLSAAVTLSLAVIVTLERFLPRWK